MLITNKFNLPQVIVDLIDHEYKQEDGRYGVTSMLNGVKEIVLKRRHWNEIEVDASAQINTLFGQAFHSMMEINDKRDDKEKKIEYAITPEFTISGKYDMKDGFVLEDYKTTKVAKWIKQDFEDYRKQGLMYAWIERKNGRYVDKVRFYLFFKDFAKQRWNQEGYPEKQIETYEFEVKTSDIEEIESYIISKMEAILEANKLKDDDIPPCTPSERWNDGDKFAVMKQGAKRASAVYDNRIEAERALSNGYYIEVRKGEDFKCDNYCEVKEFCNYWLSQHGGK